MKLIFLLTLVFATISLMPCSAQQMERDVIYLNDGTSHEGSILSYEQGGTLRLQQADGSVLEIKDADIAKIIQGVTGSAKGTYPKLKELKAKPAFKPHTEGWYNTLYVGFGFGKADGNGGTIAAGLHNVTGYQWSPAFGAGIGVGLDNYTRRGETIFPLYAEVRSFLPVGKVKSSYFFSAAGGYGFAFKREKIDLLHAEGGWMAHPAFGFRTATHEGAELLVDIGMKFQKALFVRQLDNGDVESRDGVFRRTTIRIAISLWK